MKDDENIPESGLEVLLTKLEPVHDGSLVAGFRNLGKVYFPGWTDTFPSKILGRVRNNDKSEQNEEARKKAQEKYDALKKKLEENPKFSGFNLELKKKYWWIAQLKCLLELKDELPEEFIRGHYTERARWELCCPGNIITLDETLVYGLKRQKQISKQVNEFKNRLSEHKSEEQLTRAANDIEEIFDLYSGTNWNETARTLRKIKSLEDIEWDILEKRKEISDQIRITNQRLGEKLELSYAKRKAGNREHSLRLEQESWKYLKKEWIIKKDKTGIEEKVKNPGIRMISAEELYKLKWMFLDIEIPHFKRENGQITWVGVTYIQNGKIIRKIHTIHDAGASEINGYQMIKYENSSALVDGLTKEIQEENPDGVSAFNAPFDFIKLKESEDDAFLIGGDKSSPKQKVTLENFKRLVVDDRLLIDYMRLLGKMLYKYNPNAKLPMVSGHEKSISYGEMEKLEDECFLLHQNAARTIAEYLSGDVSCLEQMHMSKLTRKALEVIIKICEFYDVGIERVAHSPNCINDVQNRGFFYTLGTHREEVPPHQRTAKMEQLREKARERFMETIIQKFIGKPESKGRFENVIKADIPIGFFMRELVEKRFPDAHKLYEYAIENRDDKPVLFLCEQFQKEFARWMIEDYGAYLGEINQFKSLLKKRKLAHEDFEEVYSGLRKHLGKISKGSLINLDQAKLKAETLRNHAAPELRDFLRSKCMKFSDFAELANQRVMIKRKGVHVIGNYAVYPREFFEDDIDEMRMYYRKPLVIEDVLNEKFEKMKKFFREKGLEIIGQEGSYVYLRGNADSIKAMDGPGAKAIKLDVIPNVYIADKIYYKKHGFLHHQKITADSEDSDNNTCLLAGRFFGSIINLLLEGKSAEAVKTFQETYWSIKSGQSAPEISDLVYKNKSKKRYSVFANNYNSGDGLVYYVESERFIPLEETEKSVKLKNGKTVKRKAMAQRQTEIDENGLRYFIDSSGGAKPKDIRVYVGMPPSIKPNINKYLEMLSERARIILAPVCPDYSLKKSGKIAKQDKNQMQMGV